MNALAIPLALALALLAPAASAHHDGAPSGPLYQGEDPVALSYWLAEHGAPDGACVVLRAYLGVVALVAGPLPHHPCAEASPGLP